MQICFVNSMNEWHVEKSAQPYAQLCNSHYHHLLYSHCDNDSDHHYQQTETNYIVEDPYHHERGIGASKISARGNRFEIIDVVSDWCSWLSGRWCEDRGTRGCGGVCLDCLVAPLFIVLILMIALLFVVGLVMGAWPWRDGWWWKIFTWVESKLSSQVKMKKECEKHEPASL